MRKIFSPTRPDDDFDFLESRKYPPHWLSSKGPNYQRGVLSISAGWCNWRTFWRKKAAGKSPRCLVLARQSPGPPGTCNPEETDLPGPMSWLPTLFSGSVPVGLPPVPWLKKQLKGHHLSSDAEVIAAAETWLDWQISEFFFEWLAKLRATG